jgi:predicted nucleic acid-binding protein
MKYVVDASVCVKWYVPEVYEQEASRLRYGGHVFHTPELVLPEFSNIIWKKVRRAELSQVEGRQIVRAFSKEKLIIHSHQQVMESAYAGAEATGQTVYDWTYLALAISQSCPLVTADKRFYQALVDPVLRKDLIWIGDV